MLGVAKATSTLWDYTDDEDEEDEDPDEEVKESARACEKRFAAFMAATPRKRQKTTHIIADAFCGDGALERCRLCGVPDTLMCASHTPAERAAYEENEARERAAIEEERTTVWKTCCACKDGWRLKDDEARAALIPPPPPGDIEEAVPCPIATCEIYWQRRLTDRKRRRCFV